jgi:serine/threonine protein phosphatase PrpC
MKIGLRATLFDGHNRWQTADFLEKELLNLLQSNLGEVQPQLRTEDIAI